MFKKTNSVKYLGMERVFLPDRSNAFTDDACACYIFSIIEETNLWTEMLFGDRSPGEGVAIRFAPHLTPPSLHLFPFLAPHYFPILVNLFMHLKFIHIKFTHIKFRDPKFISQKFIYPIQI